MRLWSIHPKFLDAQGLVALWREGLLAKKVLEGNTRGYKHHPQLLRFREQKNPLDAINYYLHVVCDEAEKRDYTFNRDKLSKRPAAPAKVLVTRGQVDYEIAHLKRKLFQRSRKDHRRLLEAKRPGVHPLFKVRPGNIEVWEKTD